MEEEVIFNDPSLIIYGYAMSFGQLHLNARSDRIAFKHAIGLVCLIQLTLCGAAKCEESYPRTAIGFGGWTVVWAGTNNYENATFSEEGKQLERIPHRLRRFKPYVRYGDAQRRATRIVGLFFDSSESEAITDADLADIGECSELEELAISCPRLGDDAVFSLGKLQYLKRLALNGTKITDIGIERLSRIDSLQALEIAHTELTDRGLEYLTRLPHLESLKVCGTSVTDRGFQTLAQLSTLRELAASEIRLSDRSLLFLPKTLRWLDLSDTGTTDTGASHLSELTKLQVLLLSDNQLTDKSLKHLSQLPLVDLWLNGNKVSFAGVKQFTDVRSLRLLSLRETAVTKEEAKSLEGAMPGLLLASTNETDSLIEAMLRICVAKGVP